VSIISENSRVLVIFPGALGDLICLGPALRALARRHRTATLELMAREDLARLAVGRMGIARGHSIDRREVAALFAGGDEATQAAGFFGAFTHVYSFFATGEARFRRSLESAVAPGAVSFHRFRPERPGHVASGYLDELGEQIGTGAPLESRIDVLHTDLEDAERALAELGLDRVNVMLLFPGSGSALKNWPLANFLALTSALPARMSPLAVLGPAEAGMGPAFAARAIATLTGQSLGTIAGLASLAAGFVGNDSGVSHLAAAAGARGVVIFGPTEPERWRPLGPVTVIRARELPALGVHTVATAFVERVGQVSNFVQRGPSLDERCATRNVSEAASGRMRLNKALAWTKKRG
jgi:ADP-heptose:LPS heptosyltransferase